MPRCKYDFYVNLSHFRKILLHLWNTANVRKIPVKFQFFLSFFSYIADDLKEKLKKMNLWSSILLYLRRANRKLYDYLKDNKLNLSLQI